MKSPDEISLTQACKAFAVANTPLFLVRKLRSDPSISELAKSFSGKDILSSLRESLGRDPADLVNAVRPYAYLVALSKKGSNAELREASTIIAPKWSWFSYISSVLLQSFSPVSVQNIPTPASAQFSTQSSLPTKAIGFSRREDQNESKTVFVR